MSLWCRCSIIIIKYNKCIHDIYLALSDRNQDKGHSDDVLFLLIPWGCLRDSFHSWEMKLTPQIVLWLLWLFGWFNCGSRDLGSWTPTTRPKENAYLVHTWRHSGHTFFLDPRMKRPENTNFHPHLAKISVSQSLASSVSLTSSTCGKSSSGTGRPKKCTNGAHPSDQL